MIGRIGEEEQETATTPKVVSNQIQEMIDRQPPFFFPREDKKAAGKILRAEGTTGNSQHFRLERHDNLMSSHASKFGRACALLLDPLFS